MFSIKVPFFCCCKNQINKGTISWEGQMFTKALVVLNSLRNANVRLKGEAALDHADILFIIQ